MYQMNTVFHIQYVTKLSTPLCNVTKMVDCFISLFKDSKLCHLTIIDLMAFDLMYN